jgi:hypothetical protein
MMSPSAKSCQMTGLLYVPELPPPVPTWTSCHCWLAPPQSEYWTTLAPSDVDAPCTSTALPLFRLISRT